MQETVVKKIFRDDTRLWLETSTPNSHNVEIRNFITKSRITKKENNIPKEFKYSLECNNLSAEKIIKNMLKLNNEVQNSEYSKVTIESNTNELNVKLTYYYEVSEEENKKQKDA